MSVTEELREMLDERGVEYKAYDNERYAYTLWGDASFSEPLAANPGTFGAQCELTIAPVTLAQAIVATMPDEASTHKALIRESDARMALQREYNDQAVRIRNQRQQLRELQTALERGKCRNSDHSGYGFECSWCGHAVKLSGEIDPTEWSYCPNCGRRVVQ